MKIFVGRIIQFWFHNYYFMTVLLEIIPLVNFQVFLNFV